MEVFGDTSVELFFLFIIPLNNFIANYHLRSHLMATSVGFLYTTFFVAVETGFGDPHQYGAIIEFYNAVSL